MSVIAVMTGITALADSELGAGTEATHAFDGVYGDNLWASGTGGFPHWIRAQGASPFTANRYDITVRTDGSAPAQSPSAWTFQGSNDGSSWTTLDSQSGMAWTSGETKTFFFANSTAYTYYRLHCTASSDVIVTLTEIVIVSDTILGVTASSELDTGCLAGKAFNQIYVENFWASNTGGFPNWIRAQMEPLIATRYAVTNRSNATYAVTHSPTAWIFQGSNDDSTWTDLDTRTGLSWSVAETKTFDFGNATSYAYYRLYCTAGPSVLSAITEIEIVMTVASTSPIPQRQANINRFLASQRASSW